MSYQRKTIDRWDIMSNYGYGWECECLEIASDFQILKVCGEVETISFNVAQWFMKHGAKVETRGIGWCIIF